MSFFKASKPKTSRNLQRRKWRRRGRKGEEEEGKGVEGEGRMEERLEEGRVGWMEEVGNRGDG